MRDLRHNCKGYIDGVVDLKFSEFEKEIVKISEEFPPLLKDLLIGALFVEIRHWRVKDARGRAAETN